MFKFYKTFISTFYRTGTKVSEFCISNLFSKALKELNQSLLFVSGSLLNQLGYFQLPVKQWEYIGSNNWTVQSRGSHQVSGSSSQWLSWFHTFLIVSIILALVSPISGWWPGTPGALYSVLGESDWGEVRVLISLGQSVTEVGVSLTQIKRLLYSLAEGVVTIPLGKPGCY